MYVWILMLVTINGGQSSVDPFDGVRHAFATKDQCEVWKRQFDHKSSETPGREHDVWVCSQVQFDNK